MSQVCVRERKKNTSDYVLGRLAIGQYFLLAIGDWITVKTKHRKKKHRKTARKNTTRKNTARKNTASPIKLTCGILYSKENCVELLHNEKSLSAEGK